jgi:Transmembrane exosortase (Exosortase_EpsH)
MIPGSMIRSDRFSLFSPWGGAGLALAGLGGYWLVLVHQLGAQWSAYPQYHYGWSVPVLVIILVWRRWKAGPGLALFAIDAATGTEQRTEPIAAQAGRFGKDWSIPLALVLAAAWLPTRLIEEANPVWRLTSWAMAIEVVGLTLCIIKWLGGSGWLKQLWFPVAFILMAVPWPSQVEALIVQSFTRLNVRAVVDRFPLEINVS